MTTRHAFIRSQLGSYSQRVLCEVVGASRSWFSECQARPSAAPHQAGRSGALLKDITRIFKEKRKVYGAPRIHVDLRAEGWKVSRKTVAKIMKQNNITPLRRKRKPPNTTQSNHQYGVAPNLLNRQFSAQKPNQVWLADITYVATDEGWLYVAAVKDMATCEIVGWSMDTTLHSSFTQRALMMAIQRHRPGKKLIHHTDRGGQYAATKYRKLLANHDIIASMSRKGDCLDNAPMESFFGSLKNELVHRTQFRTRDEARRAMFDYIEVFYNRQRLHSSIGYITPAQARQKAEAKMAA